MTQPDLKLEAFIICPNGSGEYRFLVDGKTIKYITIDPGAIPCKSLVHFPCHPRVRTALPPFPRGTWSHGHITKCPLTGNAVFGTTSLGDDYPAGDRGVWHPTTISHLDLTWAGRIRQNVSLVTCPQFRGKVVYKFAPFAWMAHRVEHETLVYKWISAHRGTGPRTFWAPRFLCHVSQEGRVIGFLMEYVAGRPPRERDEGDWEVCLRTLEKLHGLGWLHGNVGRKSFVIRQGKRGDEAVLIDFKDARPCRQRRKLVEEQEVLMRRLHGDAACGTDAFSELSGGHDE